MQIRLITGPLKPAVCDPSTSPTVNLAGARMLAALRGQLQAEGVRLRPVAARVTVRDMFRVQESAERVGCFGRRIAAANIMDELEGSTESCA